MQTKERAADFLTPEELAALLRVEVRTLYNWRTTGQGPRAHKVGRALRYARADVDAWLATCRDD